MNETRLELLALDAIAPDPDQPRKLPLSLDELTAAVEADDRRALQIWDGLSRLATSILEVGLQQPITVFPADRAGQYLIYDGHRRWLVLALLQRQGRLDSALVPCYVRSNPESDDEALLSRLNVNIQREDFNVFELARGMRQVHASLQDRGGDVRLVRADGSIETLSVQPGEPDDAVWHVVEKKMGISRPRRYQIQAVLKLPDRIQILAEQAGLPESRLRFLMPIKDEKVQETILLEMIEGQLTSVEIARRIKELQDELGGPGAVPVPKPVQVRSSIRPIKRLAEEMRMVHNVPASISVKDPRTVEGYRQLIPDLRSAILDLETVLAELEFLEGE